MAKITNIKSSTLSACLCSMGIAALTACGSKSNGYGNDEGSNIHMIEVESDSTQYGIYLRGNQDSIEWISEEGDTAWLISSYAQIFGELENGDRLAVLMNDGKANELRNVIDITQLLGRWVEPDAVEEGMMQGIELQEGGAANSINSRANHYVSWRIYNGKLLLVNTMDGMIDQDIPEDTFHIEELSKKTLKVRASYTKHLYTHSLDASQDKVKEYDDYSSPDANAFDPEGDAPEGTSPDIPEEEKIF